MKLNKGSYLLIIKIKNPVKMKVGSLGNLEFNKGYYVYVGSALNNLQKRTERHLKTSESDGREVKKHWHIDYLLSSSEAEIVEVYYKESQEKQECEIAGKILGYSEKEIRGFGCSDCKCRSHLFNISKKYLLLDKSFIKMKL